MDTYVPTSVDQTWNPRPKRGWIKWVLIAVGVVAVLAVGIFAWRTVASRRAAQQQATANAVNSAQTAADTCATGDANCVATRVGEAAVKMQSVEACKLLNGAAYDNCAWGVAIAAKDPSLCASVADTANRQSCQDGINETIGAAGSAEACNRISDSDRKNRCLTLAAGPLTSENCATRGEPAAVCADVAQTEKAVAARNPGLCDAVADESRRDTCRDLVGPGDADMDGLNASDEAFYGTSDANPDSDHDGFKDGDEVAAGFNPNGPGTL